MRLFSEFVKVIVYMLLLSLLTWLYGLFYFWLHNLVSTLTSVFVVLSVRYSYIQITYVDFSYDCCFITFASKENEIQNMFRNNI